MPTPGTMTMYFEYPALGIAVGAIELDTYEFTDAVSQVITFEAASEQSGGYLVVCALPTKGVGHPSPLGWEANE